MRSLRCPVAKPKVSFKFQLTVALAYEQRVIRTMFFERCETIKIDGKPYDISNNSNIDHFNCKLKLCEIFT